MKEGKWVLSNGNYFQGKFENNKPKGEGVWHFTNGNVVKGQFEHNKVEDPDTQVEVIKLSWQTNPEITDPTKYIEI
jgi:hypothetical protein